MIEFHNASVPLLVREDKQPCPDRRVPRLANIEEDRLDPLVRLLYIGLQDFSTSGGKTSQQCRVL